MCYWKLILRLSYLKIKEEPLKFLERIQGDICGQIKPLSGPFRYFMVLIDASMHWSHVVVVDTQPCIWLAEALIKRIKFIARPILQGCNLPTTCWGHAVLHSADLIQLRPTVYHTASPLQMV